MGARVGCQGDFERCGYVSSPTLSAKDRRELRKESAVGFWTRGHLYVSVLEFSTSSGLDGGKLGGCYIRPSRIARYSQRETKFMITAVLT